MLNTVNEGRATQTQISDEFDSLIQSASGPEITARESDPEDSNLLLSLRSGWIADQETSPRPKRQARAKQGPSLLETLQRIAARGASSLKLAIVSLPGKIASAVRESRHGMGQGARSALRGAPMLIALFAGMLAIGAALYASAVDNLFSQANLAKMFEPDSPAVAVAAAPLTRTVNTVNAKPDADGGSINSGSNAAFDSMLKRVDQAAARNVLQASYASDLMERYGQGGQYDVAVPDLTNALTPMLEEGAASVARNAHDAPAVDDQADAPYSVGANAKPMVANGGRLPVVASSPFASGSMVRADTHTFYQGFSSGKTAVASNTATNEIVRGGKAVFELQRVSVGSKGLRPGRIVVTATAVAFVPEGLHAPGAMTIPLASIKSVQIGPGASGTHVLNIEFSDRGRKRLLSFSDASLPSRGPSDAVRQNAYLLHVRDVIVAAVGHF